MIEPVDMTEAASDGYEIHVTRWRPRGAIRGHLVVLHGVQSHGGWYQGLGQTLAGRGYAVTFPDRRGSGKNTQERGHASSSRRLLDDVAGILRSLRDRDPGLPMALAGISWGGKLAVITAARRPELVDALALISPGLHPKVDVGRGARLKIALAYFINRRKHFPIPLADPALFTACPAGRAFIASDPLGLRTATAALLVASRFIDRGVRKAQGKVHQPSLLMLGGEDRIVDNDVTRAYFDRIGSSIKHIIEYPEAHHTLEFEPDAQRYALDLADWLDSTLAPEP